MKKSSIFFVLLAYSYTANSQDYFLTDSLKLNLKNAKTAEDKVLWLGELASFYQQLNKDSSDKYSQNQLEEAELSRDRKVLLKALLSNASKHYNNANTEDQVKAGNSFAHRALNLASHELLNDYVAFSYIYLARGARREGNYDKALDYCKQAESITNDLNNDSLKIEVLNALGDTYRKRNNKLEAFKNYLEALNLAEIHNTFNQVILCYQNMAEFYSDLANYEKAKDFLFKAQKLTYKFNAPYERHRIYLHIGEIYTKEKQYEMATKFYEKAISLSDTIKMEILKISSYSRIMNQFLSSNQGVKALQYINERKELRDFAIKADLEYFLYYWYGIAYTESGKFDSATYYFNKVEPFIEKNSIKSMKYLFYDKYATLHKKNGNFNSALLYWLKAHKLGKETGNLEMLQNTSVKLDSVYQKLKDYKNAYHYKSLFHYYSDSLQTISKENNIASAEVDNENRMKEREAFAAEEAKREWHNIQYMGITAAIAGVFILLVAFGIFNVSRTTIRIVGFFAFIFLFEFIILLADNKIHHWTHGEPWKILAIKIGLISVLLPLHHFLEEKVIHYLTSRKLLEVKPHLFSRLSKIKQLEQ
jgi:tetratricopeptide (TPR) repeat protein